jgi:hypothetical protein
MRIHHARRGRVGAHRRHRRRAIVPTIMLVVAGSALTGVTVGAAGVNAAPMMHYHGRAIAMHYHG